MATVPTTGAAAGTAQVAAVPNIIQQGMQIVNMRPAQGSIMQPQQVRSLTPRMILSSQMLQNVRPGQTGVLPSSPGHLLVKTENGQMHLVRVSHTPGQPTQPGAVTVGGAVTTATLPATSTHVTLNQVATSNNAGIPYRFPQSQVTVVSSSPSVCNASYVTVSSAGIASPASVTSVVNSTNNFTTLNNIIPASVNTNANNNNNNVTSNPSAGITLSNTSNVSNNGVLPGTVVTGTNTMHQVVPQQQQQQQQQTLSAESAKNKCKNFLSTLLKLASEQKQPVAKNVRSLIQGLIDSKVEPEAFTEELQKDLNSSPQPCLVPFLKRTLPFLRLSLARGEITIEGVNPPPLSNTTVPIANTVALVPSMSIRYPSPLSPPGMRLGVPPLTPPPYPHVMHAPHHLHHHLHQQQQHQQQQRMLHHHHPATPYINNSPYAVNPPPNIKAGVLRPPVVQQQQIRLPTSKPAIVSGPVGIVRVPNTVVVHQQQLQQQQTLQQQQQQQQQQQLATATTNVCLVGSTNSTSAVGTTTVLQPLQPAQPSVVTNASPVPQQLPVSTSAQQQQQQGGSSTTSKTATVVHTNKVTSTKDRVKEKQNFVYNSYSSSSVADDDINDVAAMGGVNLGEESQRILDSTGFVGTQIRSCKDETFLLQQPLQQRLKAICAKHDMEEPGKEFTALLSHAVQERLKTMVERLSIIAEHRLDIVKNEPRYEMVQDVKGQLRFLEDLDRLEKKRKDEVEREMLLRAAKSRNKNEDPEQAKLKAKAKEMQRVEMEEMRQRDANMAALKALQGPRKKAKLDLQSNEEGGSFSGTFSQKQIPLRQRTKRVNIRDLTFLMEQEKDMHKSPLLYRTYLK